MLCNLDDNNRNIKQRSILYTRTQNNISLRVSYLRIIIKMDKDYFKYFVFTFVIRVIMKDLYSDHKRRLTFKFIIIISVQTFCEHTKTDYKLFEVNLLVFSIFLLLQYVLFVS